MADPDDRIDETARREGSIFELLPEDWTAGHAALWVATSRVFNVDPAILEQLRSGRPLVFDVGSITGLLYLGGLPRLTHIERLQLLPWNGGPVGMFAEVRQPDERMMDDGAWLMLVTPERTGLNPEGAASLEIDNAIAIVRRIAGRNAAYDEPLPRFGATQTGSTSGTPGILTPTTLPDAQFDDGSLSRIAAVGAFMEAEGNDATRLRLAMRWAKRGDELSGTDAFLA